MLKEHGVDFHYREYTQEPLGKAELQGIFRMLGAAPKDLLRRNDKVFKDLGLSGDESPTTLIGLMAKHPTLLQRPIAVLNGKAVVGRPPEAILNLTG